MFMLSASSVSCLFGRYCESRRKVMLDHVHEGYDKDLWEYMEMVN